MSQADRQVEITWIIGFMGSGKSTTGCLLAERTDAVFTDTDQWIEAQTDKSVAEIFEQQGEAAFRLVEKQFVETFAATSNGKHVVACGGGLPCYNDLIALLKATGTVVYLAASVETLAERLKASPEIRPLVKGLKDEALQHDIRQRLHTRKAIYEQADTIVHVDNKTPEAIIEEILEQSGFGNRN